MFFYNIILVAFYGILDYQLFTFLKKYKKKL